MSEYKSESEEAYAYALSEKSDESPVPSSHSYQIYDNKSLMIKEIDN